MIGDMLMSFALLDLELQTRAKPTTRPEPKLSRREAVISRGYAARWRRRMDPIRLVHRPPTRPPFARETGDRVASGSPLLSRVST